MPDPPPETTSISITWEDVLTPGKAGDLERADAFVDLPPSDSVNQKFSLANAHFLAAQSLLIYRPVSEVVESGSRPWPGRHAILRRLGLEETYCGEVAGTTVSILETDRDGDAPPAATVVFRGTSHLKNWITNLQSLPSAWPGGGHVHGGFAAAHNEIWNQLGPRLDTLVSSRRPIFITGHSLGGALATLTLSQLSRRHGPAAKASAYTFGSPRVGNTEFAASMEKAPLFRLVNNDDIITRLPLPFGLSRRLSFLHSGNACFIDSGSNIHLRGQGDLQEESTDLRRMKKLLLHTSDAFRQSRPPAFLADHAPARYLERIRHAHSISRNTDLL